MRRLSISILCLLTAISAWGKKNASDYPLKLKVLVAQKSETTREVKTGTEGKKTNCVSTDNTINCDTTPKQSSSIVLHGSRTRMEVELAGQRYVVTCSRSPGLITRHIGNCGILPPGEYPARWKNGHDKLEILDGDKSIMYELIQTETSESLTEN